MNNIVFVVLGVLVCSFGVTYAFVVEDACAPLRTGGCIEFYCADYVTFPDAYDSCITESTSKGPQESDTAIKTVIGFCDYYRDWLGDPPVNWDTECPQSSCADTIVTGIPKTVLAGDTVNFTIQAVGINGVPKTTGGDTFTVNYNKFQNIVDHGNGKYTVFVHVNTECNENSAITTSLTVQCRGFGPAVTQPVIERCCYGHCVPDPHFTGFSTGTFDYHGKGDFVLCKVQDTLAQVRFVDCNGPGITCPTALAIKINGTRYEFYSGSTAKLNGVTTPLPALGQSYNITSSPHSTITRTSSTGFNIRTPNLLITVYDQFSYWSSISLDVYIKKGRNEGGLLGRVGKNGEAWGRHPTLAKPFGDSWMINTANDGIFTYTTAVPFDSIYRPNAPQNYDGCGETPFAQQAREACSILNSTSSLAQQCAGIEDVSVYYNWCVTDAICTGQLFSVDTLVSTVSAKCQRKANVTLALPTSAARSKASGPGLASTVTRLTTVQFNITSYDALGRRVTTGGSPFQVAAAPALTILRRDNNDGTYTHSYSPIIARTYTINITKSSAHIDGSPFTVNVVN